MRNAWDFKEVNSWCSLSRLRVQMKRHSSLRYATLWWSLPMGRLCILPNCFPLSKFPPSYQSLQQIHQTRKTRKPHENPIPWMSTALVSSFRGASRPQATSDIATSRGVCGVAVGSGRSGVATRRWASLSIAERFTGPNRMRGRLGHALTQLDTCWHLGTQKLRHRSTESTVDLLRSLPWSKGTAAIGILWPSQPQCCGINVWGLQLADWATSWWCGVQQNMYRYLLSTWKLLCCQRCQVMIILKEHMNGRLGEERKKKTPKTKTSGTFSDPHLPAASTILPNRPGLCNTSKCRLAKMLLPFGIYDDSRQCDTLCVPRV